jgi:hypothetical protein
MEERLRKANELLGKLMDDQTVERQKLQQLKEELLTSQIREKQLHDNGQKGLTRSNLISESWHQRNPNAAKHLFGGVFHQWSEFKAFMTRGAFPNMIVDGGSGNITEFEKLMMACMRANRAYEYETIGYIFGVDRRRVGEYIAKYTPLLGKLGLYLSILDLQLDHDYITKEDAYSYNIPHSSSV